MTSIAARLHPTGMTSKQYEDLIERLEQTGLWPPDGLKYHVCFGPDGDLRISEVWESGERFMAFAEKLIPILAELGIERGEPELLEVQKVVKGNPVDEIWDGLRQLTPYVAAQHGELSFIVPTSDTKGERFVRNRRPRQFVRLARAVKILRDEGGFHESGTIIDVGAHIGTTTIKAIREHGFSRAITIEPDPDNLRLLRANLALNSLQEHVMVIDAALSESASSQFFLPGRERGGWGGKGRVHDQPTRTTAAVKSTTLDSLTDLGIAQPSTTSLIWLGYPLETDATLSATTFFERRVPLVMPLPLSRFGEGSPLLRQLAPFYEHAVDLRHPNLDAPLAAWTPEVLPLARLIEFANRKHTDITIF